MDSIAKDSYRNEISDTDQLKCVLIDCWIQLSLNTLNQAIDQLAKRLMMIIKVKSAHVEFISTNSVCGYFYYVFEVKKLGKIHAFLSNSAQF